MSKIRTDFITNSSSSSFVLITSAETHEQVMNTLDDEARLLLGELVDVTRLFGKDLAILEGRLGDGAIYWLDTELLEVVYPNKYHEDDGEISYKEADRREEMVEQYISGVRKASAEHYYHEEQC